ncbi:hypothetical protein AB205_0172760 [Aquarana catesbeiana]|uniref:G-protein coupled receptors family 1 profile domain-containing protein n=1 Tax=Aquarana catesbeiana TaxID=8400 RepID=A0A2G9RS48_AQUCT|nr:hypothetical protein AB205_0172760 [Aquarana catesbeiana]
MYFFLRNLSFIDICFLTTITLKILANTLSKDISCSASPTMAAISSVRSPQFCGSPARILGSIRLLSTILKIHYNKEHHKAFSTSASHLTVVTLYYETIIFMYLHPQSSYFPDQDRVVSVFYTAVSSMLNPILYCVRNKDIKGTIEN